MDPGWINAGFNGLMAAVWIAYLNLFLRQIRSHQRVRVFIQLHGGYDTEAGCRIVNLSDKPVGLASVQVCLDWSEDRRVVEVTGRELTDDSAGALPKPLRSGESFELGTVHELLAAASGELTAEEPADGAGELEGFEVRLVIQHGGSEHPGAALRSFRLERRGGTCRVTPEPSTHLWYARRGRKLAARWLDSARAGNGRR